MPAPITVLILNLDRKDLVTRCLEACQRLDRDGVSARLVCIDNGSADGSVDEVRRRFPGVGIVSNESNLGFARAYNEAIQAADTEWVALLNNDTIPDPAWLTEAYAAACRHRAACVGSRMLKDEGRRIDYVGTTMNFCGHGFHPHFDEPSSFLGEERPVIAACAGAMLVRRDVFLETGGFDATFHSYLEDLDFGWRLNVLGHDVVYAPDSMVWHEHSATSTVLVPPHQRLAWSERNGLFSLIKNYAEPRLGRVLPVALALCVKRAQLDSGIDPDAYFFELSGGGAHQERRPHPRPAAGPPRSRLGRAAALLRRRGPVDGPLYAAYRLLGRRFGAGAALSDGPQLIDAAGFSRVAAIEAVTRDPAGLRARRDAVQRSRQRSDDAVVELFGDAFRLGFPHPELQACQDELVAAFDLRSLFP